MTQAPQPRPDRRASSREEALSWLHQISIELRDAYRARGNVLATEKEAKVSTWAFASSGTDRQREMSGNVSAIESTKLAFEFNATIDALIEERDFLRLELAYWHLTHEE